MAILRIACVALLASGLLGGPVRAQSQATADSAEAGRLDRLLPPASASPAAAGGGRASAAPAGRTSATASHDGTFAATAGTTPGTYYGETSGIPVADDGDDATVRCDDSTFGKPQVHGAVGVGVLAGSHASGSYRSGAFNVSKRFGDCEHHAGSLSVTVSDTQGRVDYRPRKP